MRALIANLINFGRDFVRFAILAEHTIFLLLMCSAIILLLFLTACSFAASTIPREEGLPIQVYFCREDNCSAVILSTLENAARISCAFYHLTDQQVIQALKHKNARVITDNLYTKSLAGLDVSADAGKALMHNKFCVIDEEIVLTGSYNPTNQRKEDNLVIIHSVFLAQNYLHEFEEMKQGTFHAGNSVLNPIILYNNATIKTAFCPEDGCAEKLLDTLRQAREHIRFVLYQITDQNILNFLTTAPVIVQGIIDQSQIKVVPEELKKQVMFKPRIHSKVFIIDNTTIITGSYNPTRNGDSRNDENMLIITDPALAQQYITHFSSSASPHTRNDQQMKTPTREKKRERKKT